MYTIKRAAEVIGVNAATLRAWETRYGVGSSLRTESGYRVYDDEAIRTLRAMRELVDAGWSVRAAATEVLRRSARGPSASPADISRSAPEDDIERFVAAAADYDARAVGDVLDTRFSAASFETVVDGWLMPALVALGEGWASDRVSVAAEHLAATAAAHRVALVHDAAASTSSARRALLGLPPGARHDIGLLAFSTAARRAGLPTTYLGADVPVAAWQAAVGAQSPACVVLAVPMADDVEATAATVAAIREVDPELLIAVGGSAQDLAPDGCLRLGHRIGTAAALLAHAMEQRLTPS
ncbi:MerR family transcriptional regulator [Nocardioides humilatus]|uniref:MerR family transcriptional regulator n=1 Tax=Nocardioides humilatus TaxID=2607660 RepID=A0A5B1LKF4_9ACTN|nr:MerR family transcriptional regulator [Nocardioides humilatus]KAA1420954.1 MerR family transcriptional regulator [Nocardioides humilatus]